MMNHPFLVLVLIFLLTILARITSVLIRSGPRDQAKKLVEYTQKRGFTFVNPGIAQALNYSFFQMIKNPAFRNSVSAASDISDVEGLENGTGDWLALTCNLRSKEVAIFNLSVSPKTVRSSGGIHYKVAKIQAAALPQFSLGRKGTIHSLKDIVDKMTGSPDQAIKLESSQYPDFVTRYWLRGSDPAAIRAFWTPHRIGFIEGRALEGTIATNANYLVYFENGVLDAEQDFDSFIAKVEEIVANLL